MNITEKFASPTKDHVDAALFQLFEDLVKDLSMYSEAKYPYTVFLWDVSKHGELDDDFFNHRKAVETIYGEMWPIRRLSFLQEKHRQFFEFNNDKLVKKKSALYKDKYAALNNFLGRIYTDNGILDSEEIVKMRILAKNLWELETNTVRIFAFDDPAIQYFAMGKTRNGNWIGIHTISVET